MTNTDVTSEDIRLWIDKFQNAIEILERCTERNNGDKAYIRQALSDALFLVAFVESKLKIKVPDSVYDRARTLQKER